MMGEETEADAPKIQGNPRSLQAGSCCRGTHEVSTGSGGHARLRWAPWGPHQWVAVGQAGAAG